MQFSSLNLTQFVARFNSEEHCLKTIFEQRWPRGFVCPGCGHDGGYWLAKPRTIQCASCIRQVSITSGTIFQRSKIPLVKWFLAIYLFSHDKGGCSASRMAKELGVRYTTAWLMLQKMRICMGDRDKSLTLAGTVELDEALIGSRQKRRGKVLTATDGRVQVLVIIEAESNGPGGVLMKALKGDKEQSWSHLLSERIEAEPPGHYIKTDRILPQQIITDLGHRL